MDRTAATIRARRLTKEFGEPHHVVEFAGGVYSIVGDEERRRLGDGLSIIESFRPEDLVDRTRTNVIFSDNCDGQIVTTLVFVDHPEMTDPVELMRDAVHDYIRRVAPTEAGQEKFASILDGYDDFHWGRALDELSAEDWQRHGVAVGLPDKVAEDTDYNEDLWPKDVPRGFDRDDDEDEDRRIVRGVVTLR